MKLIRSLTACMCLLTVPDIAPPDMKGVTVECRLELGPLADVACVQYRVEEGDTLSAIAKTHLGDPKRYLDILALNPTLEPDRLKIGTTFWLPPRKPNGKPLLFLFVEAPYGGPFRKPRTLDIKPLAGTLALPFSRYGRYEFYLVPHQRLATFEQKLKEQKAGEPLFDEEQDRAIVRLTGDTPSHYVDRNSPVKKIRSTMKVTKDADGKLAIRTENVHFDKDGKELDDKLEGSPGKVEPKKEALLLLLLALGGGSWLLLRARNRRPQPAMA
ncbi:MAG: LysM peptidoglycan-binding domain-containing protein [Planctomycetes bacterium]|nr:LysM peptidoglycan-binding domain-containing protein [Planctomycetota bacterium]